MDYKKFNDYELIYQVKENDAVAYNILIEKYSILVNMLAKKILRLNRNIGLEYDDLYQEGMVGIMKALNDYNSKDTLFYTYASLCAKREMDRLVKYNKRKKHMILNNSVSINKSVNNEDDTIIGDLIPSSYNLEKEYEINELYNKVLNFKNELPLVDSSILELKINGFTNREIATLLDIDYKCVDYHLHKIKKKILKNAY